MKRYLIMAAFRDFETDAPLFWSNNFGWVLSHDATVFTADERDQYTLPVSSWGWIELPEG